jgi:hypothetical protein
MRQFVLEYFCELSRSINRRDVARTRTIKMRPSRFNLDDETMSKGFQRRGQCL